MHTISPTPKLLTDEQIPSFKAVGGDCNGKAADINRAVEEGYLAATAA